MADRGQITGGLIDGPLAFDNAISPAAAAAKGIRSAVAGIADILVAPDLESANMMAKQLIYLAGADAAGIVLGARVPIILTSRADSCGLAPRLLRAGAALHQPPDRDLAVTNALLVLNAGSSSLKFALYPDAPGTPPALLRGKIAGIGTHPGFSARDAAGQALTQAEGMRLDPAAGQGTLIPALLDWLTAHQGGITLTAVGHRVVHGGRDHTGPALVTAALLDALQLLIPLAPLHQPYNLAAIRILAATAPHLPQVACFDTSFHRTQDRLAQLFALPRAMTQAGILRYGFHGLSYDYIASTLPDHLGDRAEGRVIVAHLGNGASLCAMHARRSVATSTGFTALDGLMMGQRCGALDPGVVLYLIEQMGMTASEVSTLLYERSGLLGVSGLSSDMAALQASPAPEAREAVDLFCYRAAGELAALAASIRGLDALIFTAGIGENSALVRKLICERLDWIGITLDPEANARNAPCISASNSAVAVHVIPTDEEAVIARDTRTLSAGIAGQWGRAGALPECPPIRHRPANRQTS